MIVSDNFYNQKKYMYQFLGQFDPSLKIVFVGLPLNKEMEIESLRLMESMQKNGLTRKLLKK